jgi:DNA polymerase
MYELLDPNQLFLVFDYETFSEKDIKRCGSFEYSMHPSTEVLCASFRVGTRSTLRKAKVHSWAPVKPWNHHRDDLRTTKLLLSYLLDDNIIVVAHNALFEQAITRNVLYKHIRFNHLLNQVKFQLPHERFFCTAVLASVYALPRSLDGSAAALGLTHQKDKEGHRLMLKWCKPRKPTKNNTDTRQSDPKEFDRLITYCEHDIYAETELFLTLPPHIPKERELWLFDQEINFRGIQVDRELVKKILSMIREEKELMTNELRTLTEGYVQTGGQGNQIKKWLNKKGVHLPDLKAKTVEDAIKLGLVEGDTKRVLVLRQLLNKTSLKKYTAFLEHTTSDSKVRFSLLFNGASTGRWTGSGVQLQNVPRGTIKDGEEDLAPLAADLIKQGHDLEFIRSQFENPTEVFVSCIRGMIKASEGNELFVADFAAIEARMLFWVADHIDGCEAFREGRKMYEEMAMQIFGHKDISEVTKDQRFVGKTVLLGAGYGLGWKKFMQSCMDAGREVDAKTAKAAIDSYRKVHHFVPTLWKNLEKAAVSAVEKPSKTFAINHTEWYMEGRFLCCRLPSGRSLYYCNPSIKYERTPWGEKKAVLYHWGVNSKTKKWENQKTWGGVLTENVVQAVSRDLMALAMKREEKAGYKIILTVHDEIIAERKIGQGKVDEFINLMKQLPKWAEGAAVSAEGWSGHRYRK